MAQRPSHLPGCGPACQRRGRPGLGLSAMSMHPIRGCPLAVLTVQISVDGADGRVAHEGSQADLYAEPSRQPGNEYCREQGVPAEIEEAVLDPDLLQAQHLREHLA